LPRRRFCVGALSFFYKIMKKEENINKVKLEQYITGERPPAKIKFFDKAHRLKNICYDFKNRTTDEYLQGIARNFQLQG